MILDRSPEDEPLIPAEKTRIRLDMLRKRQQLNADIQEPIITITSIFAATLI